MYVLIFITWLGSNAATVTTQEFSSQGRCLAALQVMKDAASWNVHVNALECVPK